MKRLGPIRQHLAYAIYALALVCTLSLYKSCRGANTLFVAQQNACSLTQEHPE